MTAPAATAMPAWQPLTPRGVAVFARAPLWRLLLVQFLFAAAIGATVMWCLHADWFPTIRAAIRGLPDDGKIRAGRLDWTNATPQMLAEGHFLALSVDVNHTGALRSPAHVQVEFGRASFRIFSLLGYAECAYPAGRALAFNRPELEPWWGAWSPPVLWLVFGAVLAWLLASWSLLAAVYCAPVWLLGFFANRDLNWRGSWRLAGAALMPGAVVMIAALIFYGLGALDVVQLAAAFAVHFVAGWVYLFLGVLAAPRLDFAATAKKNPFVEGGK